MNRFFFLFFFFCGSVQAYGQQIADPTDWTYELRKTASHTYELVFHVTLKDGWHIFSQDPGDEYLIPPSFLFEKNEDVKLNGAVEEHGKIITAAFEGVDSPVRYFEGKADFVQLVQVNKPTEIIGTHEYQVCNDKICLPPVTRSFRFPIQE